MVTFRHKPAIKKTEPFLTSALDTAKGGSLISDALAKALDEAMRRPSLWTSMPKTPATGKVHDWSPSYPFGTILRHRTGLHTMEPCSCRLMVLEMGRRDSQGVLLSWHDASKAGEHTHFFPSEWEPVE